jgi:hypothetical protein
MHIGYWLGTQKDKDHWEDQDVGGWTILKWVLGVQWPTWPIRINVVYHNPLYLLQK